MADEVDLQATGERIEQLLDASAAGGPVAKERAEELVRLVVDLYGSGLERILEIIDAAGVLDDALLDRLTEDQLVSGLLLVHGLHPYGLQDRVERALEKVRPYLGSHGGNVELVEVTDEGVVRLRMLGSCDGCQSSAVTLKLAVEGAIQAAAPEVVRIDVETPPSDAATGEPAGSRGFVSVDSLTARLRERNDPTLGTVGNPAAPASNDRTAWLPLPDVGAIGRAEGVSLGGLDLILCRIGDVLFAYRDSCGGCGAPIAGAAVERRLGSGPRTAVLTCPACSSHFAVERAGQGLDRPAEHLDPLPVLMRDGVFEVAVPTAVPA
jgi:Fe-S cluster biogenesis protein NfuA/nitrite reductase/ring-hydroxylating ferredoxin subunit